MVTSIYQEVELSLTENLIPVTVPVKQYDNKARKVRCVLYNNSVQYSVPQDCIVACSGTRPDGTIFHYTSETATDLVFVENGAVVFTITAFMTAQARRFPLDVVMLSTEDDIVTPSHWDCMEGRQLSIFYDCLSRHDGKENLYVFAKGTNAPTLTRNEYCMNYTPTTESSDFSLTVRRLDENDCHIVSSKAVQVKVHHKLKNKLTKNVCICWTSLQTTDTVWHICL